MTAGDVYASSQKAVDGADGTVGPEGSVIGDKSGNADQPNQLQPNDDIRVVPKPDEEGQQPILSDPAVDTTGTRPGGEAPPVTAKEH